MTKRLLVYLIIIILVPSVFPRDKSLIEKYQESFNWKISTPEAVGLNPEIFNKAVVEIRKMPFLNSLVIIKDGFLILERYYNSFEKESSQNSYSVSKSFLSALLGIALKENYIDSVQQKILDYFPEFIYTGMDPGKYDLTIQHLLTMRAGFPNDETDLLWDLLMRSPNWLWHSLGMPLEALPGERWTYSNASTHILSGIISRATGMSTMAFAKKYLFDPLGISVRKWEQDPQGYFTGGWGMHFAPRDMARFGYLYLTGGLVEELQIVPTQWIEESLQSFEDSSVYLPVFNQVGYGYLWYVTQIEHLNVYFALGYGGQLMLIAPEVNMVIVATANDDVVRYDSERHTNYILEYVTYHLLYPIIDTLSSGPYSPQDMAGFKVENRSLFRSEYMNILKWTANPKNDPKNITGYKIYILQEGIRILLREVAGGALEYMHRGVEKDRKYIYGVSTITEKTKESIPAITVIQYPND
jgi:CubicO group peptidase (beta-lactamase class C family)